MSKCRMLTLQDRLDDMTPEEIGAVNSLHRLLDSVVKNPRGLKYDPVKFVEDIEYTLQGLWGFSRDRAYHIHWLRMEGCTCSKEANDDLFGLPERVISPDCPWHLEEHKNE